MLEALLLTFQPAYLNILPMYIALLVAFAAALPLLNRPVLLVAVSGALYAVVRAMGWNLPSWTGGGWYFNPLAWQFLFAIGAALSRPLPRLPLPRRLVDAAALVTVLLGFLLVWLVWPSDDVSARVPPVLARALLQVDKEGLHPMRLLSILALTWLVARAVPRTAGWLYGRFARPVILCGQHSLSVFCVGIFLSFLGRLVMEGANGRWEAQLAVNALGTVALVGVGALSAWFRRKGRDSPPALQPAPAGGNEKVT